MNKNKTNRRLFFSKIGKGSIGAVILSTFPIKIFSSKKQIIKLKSVTPHPNSVEREVKLEYRKENYAIGK